MSSPRAARYVIALAVLAAACGPPRLTQLASDLWHAVGSRDAAAVERALDRGADLVVNARYAAGVAPLHLAAANGDIEIMALLVANGADPNLEDDTESSGLSGPGDTPLTYAIRHRQHAAVQWLIEAGARPNVSPDDR